MRRNIGKNAFNCLVKPKGVPIYDESSSPNIINISRMAVVQVLVNYNVGFKIPAAKPLIKMTLGQPWFANPLIMN